MITPNDPLTYAVKTDTTIHLYILVYTGATAPQFPNAGTIIGQTILFPVTQGDSGTTPNFMQYAFSAGSLTDIEITCDGHSRKQVIADLDNDTVPSLSGNKALGVPYSYTQKVDSDSFKAEIAIFSNSAKNFRCVHSGPVGSSTDTNSVIDTNGASAVTELLDSHTFTVPGFVATNGTHEVSVGPGRKSKTKNKNHSQTPFPRRRRRDP